MKSFFPEKFHVERQFRDSNNPDEVIGFMVPQHKQGLKQRMATAEKWAKGYRGQQRLEPIEVDNSPKTGFMISNNTRRYMNKNVVWRVIHPQGFEFEITSDNFSDFMLDVHIHRGVIQEEMVFIRNGTENYLTYVGSPQYKAAVTQALVEGKVDKNDIEPGDLVRTKSGEELIYAGAGHLMLLRKPEDKKNDVEGTVKDWAVTKSTRMQFYAPKKKESYNSEYEYTRKLDIIEVIEKGYNKAITNEGAIQFFQNEANKVARGYYDDVYAADAKPFKMKDLEVTLKPLPTIPTPSGYNSNTNLLIFAEVDGVKYHVQQSTRYIGGTYNQQNCYYLHKTVDAEGLVLPYYQVRKRDNASYWGRRIEWRTTQHGGILDQEPSTLYVQEVRVKR